VKPNNTAQRRAAILFGKWWPQIEPGEQEMRLVIMASIGVLGFTSLSPTYQDLHEAALQGNLRAVRQSA